MKALQVQIISFEHHRLDVTTLKSKAGEKEFMYGHTTIKIAAHFPHETEIGTVDLEFNIVLDTNATPKEMQRALETRIKKIFNYLGSVQLTNDFLVTYLD